MDRRKSIKSSRGRKRFYRIAGRCMQTIREKTENAAAASNDINRMKEEEEYYKEITSKTFFTAEEMATISILADIIIPKDEVSGSATDAKVPEFIEFIVKDMPEHQTPMRGGLRWLDLQCLNRYGKAFKDSTQQQQMQIVDEIAWPKKQNPA